MALGLPKEAMESASTGQTIGMIMDIMESVCVCVYNLGL